MLLGQMPTLRFEGRAPASFELPPEVPVGLPCALLERRPDVRAAELRLHGQHARIGQAIANFFPSLTVFGRFGYVSLDITTITQHNSQLYAAGPSLRIPIFEGGKTYAEMLEAEARTDEAAGNYYATILTAFREIADAIVRINAEQKVRDQLKAGVDELEHAEALATEQYDKGLTNYLTVLDADRALLDARLALVQSQRRLLSHLVQLEKALGGGWSVEAPDVAKPVDLPK
jgi:NodT family efflux transporter outer membrane factor (OMF) lipoprotein